MGPEGRAFLGVPGGIFNSLAFWSCVVLDNKYYRERTSHAHYLGVEQIYIMHQLLRKEVEKDQAGYGSTDIAGVDCPSRASLFSTLNNHDSNQCCQDSDPSYN